MDNPPRCAQCGHPMFQNRRGTWYHVEFKYDLECAGRPAEEDNDG